MELLLRSLIAFGLLGTMFCLAGCRMIDQQHAQRSIDAYEKQAQSQRAKQAGDLSQARVLLEQAIQINPQDAGNHYQLADVLTREKNNPAAVNELMRCAELAPNDARTYTRLANIMYDEGNDEKSLRLVESALRLDPYRVSALIVHARLMRKSGRFNEAVTDYQLALSQKPFTPEVAIELSELYQQLGRHDDAIVVLQQGIRESRDKPGIYEQLTWQIGLVQADLEQWDLSSHYLETSLASQTSPLANHLLTLAQVQILGGDTERAMVTLHRNLSLYPSDSKAFMLLTDLQRKPFHGYEMLNDTQVRTASAEESAISRYANPATLNR